MTADTPDPRPVCAEPGCGLPADLHGAPPGEPPNPTRSTHRFRPVSPSSGLTAEEEASIRAFADWPGPSWSDAHSVVLTDYIRKLLATLDAARAAPQADAGDCQHDHATCDACGMGFTALTPPLAAAPVVPAGLDVGLREAIIAAGPPPDALMDGTPAGQALRSWWLDKYAPVLRAARESAAAPVVPAGLRETHTQTEADLPPDHPARSPWGQAALEEIDRLRSVVPAGLDALYAAIRPEFRDPGAGGGDQVASADQRAREATERIAARLRADPR